MSTTPTYTQITCEHLAELEKMEEKEHVVIDVREPLEFEGGHIEGSYNVPEEELATNIDAIVPHKDKRVIVIAGETNPERLEKIHAALAAQGYLNTEFLSGGFDAWCKLADIEIEPELTETTPEERNPVPNEDGNVDPEKNDNEPLF